MYTRTNNTSHQSRHKTLPATDSAKDMNYKEGVIQFEIEKAPQWRCLAEEAPLKWGKQDLIRLVLMVNESKDLLNYMWCIQVIKSDSEDIYNVTKDSI